MQIRNLVRRAVKRICRTVVPPAHLPFDFVESTTLFPLLYEENITLGKLKWKWGDLPNMETLVFLCAMAKIGYTPIVEFGTFRGRTTYNLALNSICDITTIDIGNVSGRTVDASSNLDNHPYAQYVTGEVFRTASEQISGRIKLMIGNSKNTDLTHLYGTIGMVIVDGGHSYEVCMSDSEKALRLVREGGVVIWDDYDPYWPGVKAALDELSTSIKVYWLPRERLVLHVH